MSRSEKSESTFETFVPGKWVLTGEHTVLRGGTAIALPHPEFGLSLSVQPDPEFKVEAADKTAPALGAAIETLVEIARQHAGERARTHLLRGTVHCSSTIPLGAGLGSSAALCVATTRWLASQGWFDSDEIRGVATRLEDHFHGQSSGMDVAATHAEAPILFRRGESPQPLGVSRVPKFTFHDTGHRMSTKICIEKVRQFNEAKPDDGERIESRMKASSELALSGLRAFDRSEVAAGLRSLGRAMAEGHACFEAWGLLPESSRALREDLIRRGALGVKLTGAGGGGFLVALWA